MVLFRVKKLDPSARLPTKGNPADAGIDIYTTETHTLKPGETHLFSTGISVEFPAGYVALLWDRSGLGSKGIHRLAGVIDCGYRGEWKVVLVNLTKKPYRINRGEKIVQCVLQRFEPTTIKEVRTISSSERGARGFGSSGK